MFRRTDPQTSLLESYHLLPPSKQARLEGSWAKPFRENVLPLIDEEVFREAFAADGVGRPNRSIRLLTAVHLLKEWNDLTDEQVLEQLEYNLQWHYALGLEAASAHLCQKTLHNYRVKLMDSDRAQKMFDAVTRGLAEQDGLGIGRQRLDSTQVISNIAILTRLGLFTQTVTHFLQALRRQAPQKLEALESGYIQRYLDREGYFADVKKEQARRRLPLVARDLYALVQAFEEDEDVQPWESYLLLVRLLQEQCDVQEAEAPEGEAPEAEAVARVALKEPKTIASNSLQSPHDPDASYGHKGKGYQLQVSETCVEDNPYQLITAVALEGAHESDQKALAPMVEQLDDKGMKPDELFADTNFGSGENIVACARQGVALKAPVQDPKAPPAPDRWPDAVEPTRTQGAAVEETDPDARSESRPPVASEGGVDAAGDAVSAPGLEESDPASAAAPALPSSPPPTAPPPACGLGDFQFNETFEEVSACPAGQSPSHQEAVAKGRQKATFSADVCGACPFAGECPTRKLKSGERQLRWSPPKAATATRQREQRSAEFKDAYKIRSGVESTIGELKDRHGAGDLRVRGKSRVQGALTLKALALNVKRAVTHHVDKLIEPFRTPQEALAQAG